MSGDYDYLNARVRGMSTNLLSRDLLEQLVESRDEKFLMETLLCGPYAEDLIEAASTMRGPAAVELALRRKGHAVFAKLLAIAPPEPRRLLSLQLNRWDAVNVLSLIRGKLSGASPQQVLAAVLPVGEFSEVQLGELAAEPDMSSLADALTSWNYAFAFVLRRALRDYGKPSDLPAVESTLQRTYFAWALSQLQADEPNQAMVRESMRRQIDLANVVAMLDAVRDRERGAERDPVTPIPKGKLPERTLAELVRSDSMEAAFETLEETYFAQGVEKGILEYGQSKSLAGMERFLEGVVIESGCRVFRGDMLSVSVPFGFLWRTYSELVNLRIICRGKEYRMPTNAIREELVLV